MAQKTTQSSHTKDLGGYISLPVPRVLRPLPRRAQAQHYLSPGEWHSGMAAQVAGPSRSTHIPSTPFFEASPPSFKCQWNYQNPFQDLLYQESTSTSSEQTQPSPRKVSSPHPLYPQTLQPFSRAVSPPQLLYPETPSHQPLRWGVAPPQLLYPESPNHYPLSHEASPPHPWYPEFPTLSPPKKRLRTTLLCSPLQSKKKSPDSFSAPLPMRSSTLWEEYSFSKAHSQQVEQADVQKFISNISRSRYTHIVETSYITQSHPTITSAKGDEDETEKLKDAHVGVSQMEYAETEEEKMEIYLKKEAQSLEDAEYRSLGSSSARTAEDSDSIFQHQTRTISSEGTHPSSFDISVGPIPGDESAVTGKQLSEFISANQGSASGIGDGLSDLRLQEHHGILPPHVIQELPATPCPLRGFKALWSRRIELCRVSGLSAGNGSSTLEVVRSSSGPHQGLGFPKGSLWVLKMFKAWRQDLHREVRDSALTQLKRECAAYTRIEEGVKAGEVGFRFIMMVEAIITIRPDPCLILELMSTDLGQFIDKSKGIIARKDSRRILAQTIAGLATLHSIGIIHSDIKPANIFLDARGNVKIGDFGLSHVTKSMCSLKLSETYNMIRVGTPGYIAPEKVTWKGYSYPVDYWSVGWILYELVSEKKRLMDALVEDDALRHWARNYSPLYVRRNFFDGEKFDDHTLDLICGLLDPNPETRMGLKEMLLHNFFIAEDGSSEFMGMEFKALSRRKEPLSNKWDNYPNQVKYTSEPSDDSEYRWINPYGAYVADPSVLAM